MKVVAKKLADGNYRMDALASIKEVDKAFNSAAVEFAMSMGLRPEKDKSVQQVALEKLGIKNLDSVVEGQVLDHLLPLAINKRGIIPAYDPTPSTTSPVRRGRELSFTYILVPKPDYELTSYEPVTIQAEKFSVPQSDIDAEYKKMGEMYTEYVTADPHPVGKGDACSIDMEATHNNGEPMPGLSMKGRTYVSGEGFMPEGFDEQIIGMVPGETKTFTFQGPGYDDDFNEIMENVECTVTVNAIQRAVVPTFDDEWVKKNMPMYKSAQEFKDEVAKRVGGKAREEYDSNLRDAVVAEVSKRFKGSIPDAVYENTRDHLIQQLRRNLTQQNVKWEEYVESMGGEQQLGMMLMMQTRDQLVGGYALDAVFRHHKLIITDSDLDDACKTINPQYPQYVRKQMEDAGQGYALRESAERIKAAKYLIDHAVIEYTE